MPGITDLLIFCCMSFICTTLLFVWLCYGTIELVNGFGQMSLPTRYNYFTGQLQKLFLLPDDSPVLKNLFALTFKYTNMQLTSAFGKTAILACMAACGPAFLKQQQVELEVLKATSQEWIAGAPGGGKGVNYTFDIKVLTDKTIEFDSVWVSGKQLQITPVKSSSAKTGIILFTASEFTGGPGERLKKREEPVGEVTNNTATPPIAYNGAALLRYRANGISKFLEIRDFTVLPPIHGQ